MPLQRFGGYGCITCSVYTGLGFSWMIAISSGVIFMLSNMKCYFGEQSSQHKGDQWVS